MSRVISQQEFTALNAANIPHDNWIQGPADHEALSGIVATKCDHRQCNEHESSSKDDLDQSDVLAIVHAWIADEVARTRERHTGSSGQTASTYSESLFDPLKQNDDSTPPRRFKRRGAMWKTITGRMVGLANKANSFHDY